MALADLGGNGVGSAVKVAIGAELVLQLTGANMSSPQTAELNAAARAPTIGKCVNLNNAEALGWLVFLSILDGGPWFAVGGALAGVGMFLKYRYAIRSGLNSSEPATENYRG